MRTDMRFALVLSLLAFSPLAVTQAQQPNADRVYPAAWTPLLRALTKSDVDVMQTSANAYCGGLNYTKISDLYSDVNDCTLSQATAIMSIDVALSGLDDNPPTKYRPDQIKKCWSIYRALGPGDVENLANCFGKIQYFELLDRVAGDKPEKPAPVTTDSPIYAGYCEKVAQAAGGPYMILEECIRQENASRRRLGR